MTITKMMTTRTPMIVPIRPLFMTSSFSDFSQTRAGAYAACTPQRVVFYIGRTPAVDVRRRAVPSAHATQSGRRAMRPAFPRAGFGVPEWFHVEKR